jgi:hypothetical protein
LLLTLGSPRVTPDDNFTSRHRSHLIDRKHIRAPSLVTTCRMGCYHTQCYTIRTHMQTRPVSPFQLSLLEHRPGREVWRDQKISDRAAQRAATILLSPSNPITPRRSTQRRDADRVLPRNDKIGCLTVPLPHKYPCPQPRTSQAAPRPSDTFPILASSCEWHLHRTSIGHLPIYPPSPGERTPLGGR